MRDVLDSIHAAIAEREESSRSLQLEVEALGKAAEILEQAIEASPTFAGAGPRRGPRPSEDSQSRKHLFNGNGTRKRGNVKAGASEPFPRRILKF